jgi:hypothetical protein
MSSMLAGATTKVASSAVVFGLRAAYRQVQGVRDHRIWLEHLDRRLNAGPAMIANIARSRASASSATASAARSRVTPDPDTGRSCAAATSSFGFG